ncbi:MAG: SPOR domain-containing protein [Cytophagaceae bacterium]|nr:SPOR domain-containing protein [Cytophagaceae bacterium]
MALVTHQLSAQTLILRETRSFIEAGSYFSPQGPTPFWLRANQYGIVPNRPAAGVLRGGIYTDYRPDSAKRKSVDVGYGLDVVLNTPGQTWQVFVPEAYVKVRLWPFEVYAGRRREVFGLVDTLLTSGAFIWSGNTLPVPKLQISIPDYWPAKSIVGFKGTFAHGFFENSRPFVKNGYLHQKSFYLRFGKPNWMVKLHGGFNHQVQWGGTSPFYSTNGKLPSSLEAYWFVVSGKSVAGDNDRFGNDFDGGNHVGNHLGTVDGAIEISLRNSSLLLYRQSIYEDGSLYRLINIQDGLNGVSWQNRRQPSVVPRLQRLTLEYLYTMSQGGADHDGNLPLKRGRDNYFNHGQYRDGWSYFGRTLGTPFITANGELRNDLPAAGGGFTSNNRVRVWHLGLAGRLSEAISFSGKVSYSQNAGTYDVAYSPERNQWSAYLSCATNLAFLEGTELSTAVGWDRGQLLDNALGINIRLRKTWVNRYRKSRMVIGPGPTSASGPVLAKKPVEEVAKRTAPTVPPQSAQSEDAPKMERAEKKPTPAVAEPKTTPERSVKTTPKPPVPKPAEPVAAVPAKVKTAVEEMQPAENGAKLSVVSMNVRAQPGKRAIAPGNYYVVVGGFEEESNALSFQKKLQKKGYPQVILLYPVGKGLIRVAVAELDQEVAATQLADQVRAEMGNDAWVLKSK